MNLRPPARLETEPTPEGEQTLVPGVRPITLRDRLAGLAATGGVLLTPKQKE